MEWKNLERLKKARRKHKNVSRFCCSSSYFRLFSLYFAATEQTLKNFIMLTVALCRLQFFSFDQMDIFPHHHFTAAEKREKHNECDLHLLKQLSGGLENVSAKRSSEKCAPIIAAPGVRHRSKFYSIFSDFFFSYPFLLCACAGLIRPRHSLHPAPILTSLNRFTFFFFDLILCTFLTHSILPRFYEKKASKPQQLSYNFLILRFRLSPFQPHDSGYVLLGDLTLDSSTDPEDVYHMVSWTHFFHVLNFKVHFPLNIFSSLCG